MDLISVPKEVLDAANLISNWAKKNNYKDWQLMGLCDRSFAQKEGDNIELKSFLNLGRAFPIPENSWLYGDEYDYFVAAYEYAFLQPAAISGLSKLSPEEAYFIYKAMRNGTEIRKTQNYNGTPDCPNCGNNRQIWTNQITKKLTCHRVGCNNLEL